MTLVKENAIGTSQHNGHLTYRKTLREREERGREREREEKITSLIIHVHIIVRTFVVKMELIPKISHSPL